MCSFGLLQLLTFCVVCFESHFENLNKSHQLVDLDSHGYNI
jgi:hypothetical protein